MTNRSIIKIDETLCNGCGICINACAEGALSLIDGKARLVSDVYCDGLGACIGECPTGALIIEQRDAADFIEVHVEQQQGMDGDAFDKAGHRAGSPSNNVLACGCPGSHEMTLAAAGKHDLPGTSVENRASELSHWPIKLVLLNPMAPFLAGSDLLLLSDCAAVADPNLHKRLITERTIALACPKFDDVERHVQKLAEIIMGAGLRSITVAHMEVPCCNGLFVIAKRAVEKSRRNIPVTRIVVSRSGQILGEERTPVVAEHAHTG